MARAFVIAALCLVALATGPSGCTNATLVGGGDSDAASDAASDVDATGADAATDAADCTTDGCACVTDEDCESGRCVDLDGASLCLGPCSPDAGCAEGFACEALEHDGGTAFFCVPDPDACVAVDELCNDADDDCDGAVDEDFDLQTDLSNCGACGATCNAENARLRCVEGACDLFSCVPGWVDCDGDLENGCETPESGVDACDACTAAGNVVGEPCGACDSGVWDCSDTGAFFCDGDLGPDALNACGGCADLAGVPGDACGVCERDVLVCADDGESVVCSGDSAGNPCGGCAELDVEIGAACGACGAWSCNAADPDTPICVEGRPNACGGCGDLAGAPGAGCGRCGIYECDEDVVGTVVCIEGRMNACGGCGPLDDEPGERCGECGEFACSDEGDGSVVCVEGRPNVCGGCGPLGVELGTDCGECGTWDCADDGSGRPVCVGEAGRNACGGCGPLSNTLGRACGRCGLDEYVCVEGDAACSGDSVVNVCGGCDRLDESPGTPCSRSGCSSPLAIRACVDPDTVECRCERDVCGNGLLEADEPCDDGNTTDGDGCSAECTLEALGAGEGTCAAPIELPLDSVSDWNLCRYADAVTLAPGPACPLASVGREAVFVVELERASRLVVEATDDAEAVDVDVVIGVAAACDEAVTPLACNDRIPCDDADDRDGCIDEMQPREARIDRVFDAGRWFIVVEARRSVVDEVTFDCGSVRVSVHDDGERR